MHPAHGLHLLDPYRHLHLLAVARPAPEEYCDVGLTKYHMEASQDDFNLLSIHLALPVTANGAKLNYNPAMYNHVSQAVFFHNPEYQRTPRTAFEGLPAAPVAQVVPALWQLHRTTAGTRRSASATRLFVVLKANHGPRCLQSTRRFRGINSLQIQAFRSALGTRESGTMSAAPAQHGKERSAVDHTRALPRLSPDIGLRKMLTSCRTVPGD